MDFSKWRKIFYIVAIVSMLLSIKTKVFGAFDYMNTIKTLQDGDTSVDMVATYDNKNFKIPSWVYDYNNILITMNSQSNSCIGYIIVSNNKIYIDNTNGSIGVEAGTYYLLGINYRSNYDYSNKTKNDFLVGTYNSKQIRWSNQIGSGANGCIAFKGLLYNYSDDEIYADSNPFNYPHFDNVDEIEEGYPNGVYISRGDYSSSDNLYFHLLSVNNTTVPSPGNSVFYYSDNMYELNNESSYYKQWLGDNNEDYSYYYIPRYKLSYDMNTSYVYVLSNSPAIINNSYNHIEIDTANGIYDVLESDTTGVMTATDEESDRLKRIEDETVQQANNSNSINNSLTNTTTDSQNDEDISNNLDFNNNNTALNGLNGGFFTRLTSMLSNLLGYNLSEDTSVSFPVPNSNKNIVLHSIDIYNNVTGAIRIIINAFWVYIFSFYMWRFINKIYIAVSSGNILDTFSSSGEAITNNML